jgi:hypothetical protein
MLLERPIVAGSKACISAHASVLYIEGLIKNVKCQAVRLHRLPVRERLDYPYDVSVN